MEDAIKGASDVLDKLIGALTKLASVTNDSATEIGHNDHAGGGVAANEASVKSIIENVKEIIEVAEKSGVKIETGSDGDKVDGGDATAPAVLASNAAASG